MTATSPRSGPFVDFLLLDCISSTSRRSSPPPMDEAVMNRLQVLGFSLYEARVYVALLRHGPQNGNEVSKSAGLPSSKVYSTLERLVSKGIVQSVRHGSATHYV